MKITNKLGLPTPLVRAVTFSEYDREGCDYTVTELIRPPRIRALERLHKDELSEDASERLWLLLGSAGHEVLRRSADSKGIVEERAIVEIDGKKVGGQIDYAISGNVIYDFKFTSVWVTKEGPRPDWVEQLNCYRFLAGEYGVEIAKLQIVAIFRDWSIREARRDKQYAQAQVAILNLPIWGREATLGFLRHRIALHEAAAKELPLCTDDEVWARPPKFAVMKKGNVRALRVFDNLADAKSLVDTAPNNLTVEVRPGERPRCESYCSVAEFCTVWQDWKRANAKAQNP